MSDENSSDKLACIDCAHCEVSFIDWLLSFSGPNVYDYKCKKVLTYSSNKFNPVIGYRDRKSELTSCKRARNYSDLCGPKGKYWTPKHKRDLFKMLMKDH